MSLLAEASGRAPTLSARSAASLSSVALALSVALLAWRLSPAGVWAPALALGALTAAASLCCATVAGVADLGSRVGRERLRSARLAGLFAAVALALFAAAASGLPGDVLSPAFGLLSLALLAWLTLHLARSPQVKLDARMLWLAAGLTLALLAYNVWYVTASRDLEIADFMFYRLVSIAVASLIDSGHWPQLAIQLATSLKADYSWLPSLLPGAALALGAPLSRAVYQIAIMTFYAAPALIALGWLSRELALRFVPPSGKRSVAWLAFGAVAAAAIYPTGLAVAARGMPDIGGLALYVYALRLADRLARAVALPRAGEPLKRIALALVLTLVAMVLFRRWYAFAAIGIVLTLALELFAIVVARGRAFPWRNALSAAAPAAPIGLALISPVLVDWLPDPAKHDYANIYAAYRKPADVFLGVIGDWWGFAILAFATLAGVWLVARSRQARLARLTFGTAIVAAALFLRVQTPYVHHVFLIAPAIIGALGAVATLAAQRSRLSGSALIAVVAALTLTPLGALAPKGLFPVYGQPHRPRADLAELARMKDWVDAQASPAHKVCGLGSSYTFSGQLIDELWQLKADRSPLHLDKRTRASVPMSDVDTVEGPPARGLEGCAVIIVGDPVQTHLIPAYQQTVIVPSREMLQGVGIGEHYRRNGESFHLENGVEAVVFERTMPLTDADMDALAQRWRAARAAAH